MNPCKAMAPPQMASAIHPLPDEESFDYLANRSGLKISEVVLGAEEMDVLFGPEGQQDLCNLDRYSQSCSY